MKSSGIAVPFYATSAPIPWPQQAKLVASFEAQGDAPQPLTLLVTTNLHNVGDSSGYHEWTTNTQEQLSGYRTVRRSVELAAGLTPYKNPTNDQGGALIVTYGAGGTERRLVCDLRPGSYALPPCESARVEALVWSRSFPFAGAFSVSATFVPGSFAAPSRFTHTYEGISARYGQGSTVYEGEFDAELVVPDGARWLTVWQSPMMSDTMTPLRLQFSGGSRVVYDYAAGNAPLDPLELPAASMVTVRHEIASGKSVSVRFYLEP